MKKSEARFLRDKIDVEGGPYDCFVHYSEFSEIKDKKFRQKVDAFVAAAEDLQEYLDAEYERHGLTDDD